MADDKDDKPDGAKAPDGAPVSAHDDKTADKSAAEKNEDIKPWLKTQISNLDKTLQETRDQVARLLKAQQSKKSTPKLLLSENGDAPANTQKGKPENETTLQKTQSEKQEPQAKPRKTRFL